VSISLDEVRHIAALARLGLTDERARAIAGELTSILEHMQVLSKVDITDVDAMTTALLQAGMIPRLDEGPPIALERPLTSFAPELRDGFFLVPRLTTHEDMESSA
jgi:aspartyl-tRNA(Asn)/glutamyl-tRNA(Gln) amidotransferase subunit C